MFEGLYYSLDPYIYICKYIYIYPLGNGGYHNGTPYQPSVHCFISTKAEVRLSSTMTLRERTPDVWRHRGIGDALQPKTFQRLNLRCESLSVSNPHLGVRVIYLSIYLSLSIFIYLYLSLSIIIYHYLSLSIIIYHYLSLSIIIYHYLSLSIIIYHYLSLSIIIYHYLSLSIIIYHYLSLSIIIYLSIYLSLSIYLFIYLFIYHYLSIYLCIHTHTWILASWHLEWYPVGRQDAYTMQKKALGEGSFGSAFRATCKSSRPVAMMFPLFYPG